MKKLLIPLAVLSCEGTCNFAEQEKAVPTHELPCEISGTIEDLEQRLRLCNTNIMTQQKLELEQVASEKCGDSNILYRAKENDAYKNPEFKGDLARETDISYVRDSDPYDWNLHVSVCAYRPENAKLCSGFLTEFSKGKTVNTVEVSFTCGNSKTIEDSMRSSGDFASEVNLEGLTRGLLRTDLN